VINYCLYFVVRISQGFLQSPKAQTFFNLMGNRYNGTLITIRKVAIGNTSELGKLQGKNKKPLLTIAFGAFFPVGTTIRKGFTIDAYANDLGRPGKSIHH
jgi:hypothetical protein